MDKQDDFQLDDLKDMLNDVPETDDFDLDSIIAEVNGQTPPRKADSKQPAAAQSKAVPKQTAPKPAAAQPKAVPKQTAPKPEAAQPKAEPKQTAPKPAAAQSKAVPKQTAPKPVVTQPKAEPKQTAPKPEVTQPKAESVAGMDAEIPDLSAFEQQTPQADEREEKRRLRAQRAAERQARHEQKRAEKQAAAAAAAAALEAEKQAAREAQTAQDAAMQTVQAVEETAAEPVRVQKQPKPPKEKLTREERRERAREEEDEDIELRDPLQAQQAFKSRMRGLSFRSLLVLILALASVYLSLAPKLEILPLPSMLDAGSNKPLAVGALLVLQFVALFLAIDIFGLGFYNIIKRMPDRTTLVSLAVVATLVHGATIIVLDNQAGPETPYIAVSMLMLYAAMREERNRFAARYRAYKAISQVEQPMALYSHFDKRDDSCRAVKGPLHNMDYFLKEMERPDTIDRFSMIFAPLVTAAAVVLSLLVSFGQGEPMRFFWAFSALLCISAPLGLICAYGASYKNVCRKLLGSGAAIAGARQANTLRGTEEVVLMENELFPSGTIVLEAIENFGQLSDEKILAVTAAMASAEDLELGRMLTAVAEERNAPHILARNVRTTEGGIVGEVGGGRAIFGSAALMIQMGLRIRPAHSEDETCSAYLVIENTLVGVLTLRYIPTKSTYRALRTMRRMHMDVALAVRDFNISPAMVESMFDLRRGFADEPDRESVENILSDEYTMKDAPMSILTQEGAGPMVQVLRCAEKLAGAVRSNVVLGTFAGVCGMAIVFYLLLVNSYDALIITNLLLYQLLWYVPAFLITQQTH